MSGRRRNGRNLTALALSAICHVIFLGVLISQAPPDYELPEPAVPAMDARIVTLPPITPPPVVIPPKVEPTPKPTPPPPRQTAPPTPQPPKPATPKPTPPAPTPPKPTPPKPTPAPSPLPAPAPTPPSPSPAPKPAPAAAPAPVVPNPGPPKPAPPTAVTRPTPLNLHKSKEEAPAGVPTLPLAPAAGSAGQPAGAAGAPGQSRLNGLTPFSYGAMPSGGPGLRGTLVGCANADSVGLSSAERARCNERFGEDVAHAPVLDGIDPAKRAAYDKSVEREEANRKYRSNTNTQGAPSDPGGIAHGPESSVIYKHNAWDHPQ